MPKIAFLLFVILAVGCASGRGSKPAGQAVGAPTIKLVSSSVRPDEATYTWSLQNVALTSATLGATTVQSAPAGSTDQVSVDLKENPSHTQVTAMLTLSQAGSSETGSSNISLGTATPPGKLLVANSSVSPFSGTVVLAKGQVAFPDVTISVH